MKSNHHLPPLWSDDFSLTEDSNCCRHGRFYRDGCESCDADAEDIDKGLLCGRYRSSSALDKDQVCRTPCRNPREY